MADGWIKLYRSIQEHWIWNDEPYDKARAWIDLLFLANYEDVKTTYKGEVITCKRGDVNFSIQYLADRWKWSRKKVTAYLRLLEKDEMVTLKVTTHRTTVTIVNYDNFQCEGTTKGTTKVTTRVTAKVTTEEQQKHTIKEIKEIKESKEIKNNNPPTPLKNKPESQRELFDRLCERRNISGPLKECLHDWITYKSERKEVYKEQGMKSFISQMEKNESKYGSSALIDCIEQCMGRNYKGIITDLIVKDKTPKQPKGQMSDEEFINMWRNA